MFTRIVLLFTAIVNGALGLLISFFPEETLQTLAVETNGMSLLLMKILGAMFLGFAAINYFSKDSMIGGIFNRPLLIGNLLYHGVVAGQLTKYVLRHGMENQIIALTFIFYVILFLGFVKIFVSPPPK